MLLLDVDGVLSPYAAAVAPAGYVEHLMKPNSWMAQHPGRLEEDVPDLVVRLNPAHGPAIQRLGFDLVWATTWEHDANEWIGWRAGLPKEQDYPVIEFGDQFVFRPDGTYVKTWPIVAYAAGRPFAWVDDQIDDVDRAYVAEHHPGPALLHHVDPAVGLTDADFAALADWAARLRHGTSAVDGEEP